jgi:hypothetical protein
MLQAFADIVSTIAWVHFRRSGGRRSIFFAPALAAAAGSVDCGVHFGERQAVDVDFAQPSRERDAVRLALGAEGRFGRLLLLRWCTSRDPFGRIIDFV